jgi:hypothetical protein
MVVYVAGYPAIMGLQPLYFRDPELARRARMAAEPAETRVVRSNRRTAQRAEAKGFQRNCSETQE